MKIVLLENFPALAEKPGTLGFIVFVLAGVLGAVAGKWGPQAAAYNVLDKPNAPVIASMPPSTAVAPPMPRP